MRHLCWTAVLLCRILPAQELTPAQTQLNLDSFEHIWTTVENSHWDPKFDSRSWKAAHDELLPSVKDAGSMAQARKAMGDLLARLHESHYGIIPVDVYEDVAGEPKSADEGGRTGIDARVLNGQALVVSVEAGSPAEKAGVRTGWRIVAVGGKDLAPALAGVENTYRDSTLREMILSRTVTGRLSGAAGGKITVRLEDGEGANHDLTIELSQPRGEPASFGNLPPQLVWVESRKLDGNVGYLAFNMFLDPPRLMPAFEAAIQSFQKTDGIVIDLRGNPGGIGIMAIGLAGWFIDKPDQRLGTMQMRGAPLRFVVNPRFPNFRGRLAILIDGSSASTSEIFAGGIQDLKRGRVFGTRSAGAALPSAIERLPNGDGFQFALADYVSESGRRLEGAGVTPDVMAPHTRELLLAGRDAALEAALNWIHNK